MTAPTPESRSPEAYALRKRYAESHPEDPRHGTGMSFYSYWGCRCPRCAEYASRYHDVWRVVNRPHEPSLYFIAEHRAFGEPLCRGCRLLLATFAG